MALFSGALDYDFRQLPPDRCAYCKRELKWSRVILRSRNGHQFECCHDCAGLEFSKAASPRESRLRGEGSFVPGTPRGIVADWLEERGRNDDAAWLRSLDTAGAKS